MPTKDNKKGTIYIPQRLKKSLALIFSFPLTVVKAGSGFGKTTAVSEYLNRYSSNSISCYWYTCLGEPPERAWSCICTLLSHVNSKTSDYLKKLILPTWDTLGNISLLLDEMSCDSELVLVIDNYQLAGFSVSDRLIQALSLHHCPNLHIIVITQNMQTAEVDLTDNPRIHRIEQEDLSLSREDIVKWFSKSGIKLTEMQRDELLKTTEGWVAALRLTLSVYLRTGTFECGTGMEALLNRAIWNQLTEDNREFLLSMSVLQDFTERQASVLMDVPCLSEDQVRILSDNFFVYYDPHTKAYSLHNLLRQHLLRKLEVKPLLFQNSIYQRAGMSCAQRHCLTEAALLFIKAGEYADVLKLPFGNADILELIHENSSELYLVISHSPNWLLAQRHQLILGIGIKAMVRGRRELFGLCFQTLIFVSDSCDLCTKAQSNLIQSEIELIRSLLVFNDAEQMCLHHQMAYSFLDGPTNIRSETDAWTSNAPSIVYMFWKETERLSETFRRVTDGMPCYYNLTDGHGMGAPDAMNADICLQSGDDPGAEAFCYKSLYLANSKRQDSIAFCAEFTLCRIAVLRGDMNALQIAADAIRHRAFEGFEAEGILSAELCDSFIYAVLGFDEKIPEWLTEISSIRARLCSPAVPFAQIIFAHFHEICHPVFFEAIIEELIKEADDSHMLLPKIYYLILRAIHSEKASCHSTAVWYLSEALARALPDRVYLPFAEYYSKIQVLLDSQVLICQDKEGLGEVIHLGRRMAEGIKKIRLGFVPQAELLTLREKEIAKLAKERLSAKEIAKQLSISVSTVNSTLKIIYNKLDIHSKHELSTTNF